MPVPAQDQPTGAGTATLDRDITLLFATRCLRMFGYGFLSTVLVLYLSSIGLSGSDIGQNGHKARLSWVLFFPEHACRLRLSARGRNPLAET